MAIVTEPEDRWSTFDGTRPIENMTIQAWTIGIGRCWVGTFEKEQAEELLNVKKKNLDILTVMSFGFPARYYKGRKNPMYFKQVEFLGSYRSHFPI